MNRRPLCTRLLELLNTTWLRFQGRLPVAFVPWEQIHWHGTPWQAIGTDALFELATNCPWSQSPGWYHLELDLTADKQLPIRLLFELEQGFEEPLILNCPPSVHGRLTIPLFIPPHCRAIRLATSGAGIRFALSVQPLRRLRTAPELEDCFLEQLYVYEQLGWRQGNGAMLVPEHGMLPSSTNRSWQSTRADAAFHINHLPLDCRWYMVEMRLCSDDDVGNAAFLVDDDQGATTRLELPFHSGLTMKRLFRPAASPWQIRFVPLDQAGSFSVERLHFEPVPAFFAYHRMLRRLRNCVPRYRDWPVQTIAWDILAQARSMRCKALDLLTRQYDLTFPAQFQQGTYEHWMAAIEQPENANLAALHIARKHFRFFPLIAVVLRIGCVDGNRLQESMDSVRQQSYPRWELHPVIAEGAVRVARPILEEFARLDQRIFLPRPMDGEGSSQDANNCPPTTYDWLIDLDADDLLASHALHFIVQSIHQHPEAEIIYSDEDSVDEQGIRSDPLFKPDWNPDLFFSCNYVSRLCAYHRTLFDKSGNNRDTNDYASLLRCLLHLRKGGIIHIPQVLYHRRKISDIITPPASSSVARKTSTELAALKDFFASQGCQKVLVEPGNLPSTHRVRYPIPQPPPLVSLIIPTRDMLEVLEPCLRSILDKTRYSYYEIMVVDNGSTEPATLAFLEQLQREEHRVRVLPFPHPFNYSAINNFAVGQARGEVIGLVNNDIEVICPEWLTEMVSQALRPEIGCVGAKLYYTDGSIQHGGVILGLGGVAGHAHRLFPREAAGYGNRLQVVHNLSAVTAACLVVHRSVYLEVGGLEEEHLQVAFNDVDFCVKVREAGYRNLWTPYAELFHHESKSRGMDDTPEKQARFQREFQYMQKKWGELLRQDPCYNPNLTFRYEDFSIG